MKKLFLALLFLIPSVCFSGELIYIVIDSDPYFRSPPPSPPYDYDSEPSHTYDSKGVFHIETSRQEEQRRHNDNVERELRDQTLILESLEYDSHMRNPDQRGIYLWD